MADAETAERIRGKLEALAVPMAVYDFSRETYNRLFPSGEVKTPLGMVKLGEHQFEKLKAKNRGDLLGAMHQTLSDPVAVIKEGRDGDAVELYIKSFTKNTGRGIATVMSVIVRKDEKRVSISTHQKDMNNVLNKIKNPGDVLHEHI